MKYFQFVLLTVVFIFVSGCSGHRDNTMGHYEASMMNRNYKQAANNLRRCVIDGPKNDKEKCAEILAAARKDGASIEGYLKLEAKNIKKRAAEKRAIARLKNRRSNKNPWAKLALASEIKKGTIQEEYTGEVDQLIKDAFFGFGECAQDAQVDCMVMYGQMILKGIETLPKKDKKGAKKNALYWLNLSARYGNKTARKVLIKLQAPIPSPDLAMEQLQREANSQTVAETRAREAVNRQLMSEIRRQNYVNSMQSFFPKMVNCTSNRIGSTVYTNCY